MTVDAQIVDVQTHWHTTESKGHHVEVESLNSPQVLKMADVQGLDAIFVTDHDKTSGYRIYKRYAIENNLGIVVINGIEVSTAQGHMLGWGVPEGIESRLKAGIDYLEAADIIKSNGGIACAPHVSAIGGLGILVKNIDCAIEVFNAMNLYGGNDYAMLLAKKLDRTEKINRVKVAGGDAHMPCMILRGITVVNAEKNEESILNALKNGKIARLKNCDCMTLKEMKDYSMERIVRSYHYIKSEIKNGWPMDSFNRRYMRWANAPFMKPLETAALEAGVRNPESWLWDAVAKISNSLYSIHAKKRFADFEESLYSI